MQMWEWCPLGAIAVMQGSFWLFYELLHSLDLLD